MKTGLAHVCIEVRDLEATEAFYNVLGLRRQFEFRNLQGELVGFYLAFPNRTYIEVIKVPTAGGEGNIRHFAIEVDDVDGLYQGLKGVAWGDLFTHRANFAIDCLKARCGNRVHGYDLQTQCPILHLLRSSIARV